jgi:hypothetical protein
MHVRVTILLSTKLRRSCSNRRRPVVVGTGVVTASVTGGGCSRLCFWCRRTTQLEVEKATVSPWDTVVVVGGGGGCSRCVGLGAGTGAGWDGTSLLPLVEAEEEAAPRGTRGGACSWRWGLEGGGAAAGGVWGRRIRLLRVVEAEEATETPWGATCRSGLWGLGGGGGEDCNLRTLLAGVGEETAAGSGT